MVRKQFLKFLTLFPFIPTAMKINKLENITNSFSKSKKLPLLFIGHGHPMNALFDNDFTQTLTKIGNSIEKPNAIMVVSAHWETNGTFVSINPQPKAIYDFGGFDERLFNIKYEPKGHPEFAKQVLEVAPHYNITTDNLFGLDHGAWTVLK
jgi:4,5-DOPA dioxygenase extradiol